MTRPGTPPPELRPTVTAQERTAIERVLGPVPDEPLLRAVRDARGRAFQRLEFLGDSVLDLVLSVHVVVQPGCRTCSSSGHRGGAARLVTDRRLAELARARGLGEWLEWEASDDRLADLVEAAVAAAWLSGGWVTASQVVSDVVHPLAPSVAATLAGAGWPEPPPGSAPVRRLGAAVLELAAALGAYQDLPDADEGELSQHRAAVHRADRVAGYAARTRVVDPRGDPDSVSNRVESWLASALVSQGVDEALRRARDVLAAAP